MPNVELLLPHTMMNALAGRCDGARSRDDRGFDGTGAKRGKTLALKPVSHWTPKDVWQAYRIAQRHTRQLAALGFDTSTLTTPAESDDDRLITVADAGITPDGASVQIGQTGYFVVYAPYGDALNAVLSDEVPTAQKLRTPLWFWQIEPTADAAEALLAVAARLNVPMTDTAAAQIRRILSAPAPAPAPEISCHDRGWVVRIPRNQTLIDAIKTIPYPGRRWGPELAQPGWVVAPSAANARMLRAIADTFGLRWTGDAWQRADEVIAADERIEQAQAEDATPAQTAPARHIRRLPEGDWAVYFPPDTRTNAAVGRIRGTRWQGPILRYWRVPGTANATKSLLRFSTAYNVPFADEATLQLARQIAAVAAPTAHRPPLRATQIGCK